MTRKSIDPSDYFTMPPERMTVTDLTDAIGIQVAAELIGTTPRAVYVMRNKNTIHVDRLQKLVAHFRSDEKNLRERLVIKRNHEQIRAEAKANASAAA